MARYTGPHHYKPGECRGGGRYWNATIAEAWKKKLRCRVCGKMVRITTKAADNQGYPVLRIAYHMGKQTGYF